ncbi:MAG: hypothetical protein IPM37_10610 [Hahellaceae bacterium]|jgi:hypothetical protein|nr:hypothetical protein [Hahellaceae bacterium]
MLMSAPFASTLAAGLVLFGMTYTANSVLNALIRRAQERKIAQENTEDTLTEV